jgi:hypothetical protein
MPVRPVLYVQLKQIVQVRKKNTGCSFCNLIYRLSARKTEHATEATGESLPFCAAQNQRDALHAPIAALALA